MKCGLCGKECNNFFCCKEHEEEYRYLNFTGGNQNKTERKADSEAVVHHIHHKDHDDGYRREVSINGSIYSISMSSDDPKENIEYLSDKSMKILKELIKEGK
jgi:hypothetical protein